MDTFVFVQRALSEIPGASADQVDDGGALQLHGFVLVAGGRVLQIIQIGVGSVEGVVVVSGDFFQIDRTRIVGSVEAVHVEGFASVESFVGAGGFDRAGVGRGLGRRTNGVDDRNVDGGRVEGFGFLFLLVEFSRQGLRAVLVVTGGLMHVGGRRRSVMMIVVAVGRGWEPVGALAETTKRAGRWWWWLAVAPEIERKGGD